LPNGDFVADSGDFVASNGDFVTLSLETATWSPETGDFVAAIGDYSFGNKIAVFRNTCGRAFSQTVQCIATPSAGQLLSLLQSFC